MSLEKAASIMSRGLSPITPLNPLESVGAGSSSTSAGSGVPFADMLSKAMKDMADTQHSSTQDAYDLVMGTGSDLHSIMMRNAIETTAVETAVELTARVVGVYKEIMQMQV